MSAIHEFGKLETDKARWEWLLANKGSGLVVMLDNDDTFVVDRDDDDCNEVIHFNEYLGWSYGVILLLKVAGIDAESV